MDILFIIKFVLTSISSDLLFWSGNYNSIYETSELKVFKNIKLVGKFSQINYLELLHKKISNLDNDCQQRYNWLILLRNL